MKYTYVISTTRDIASNFSLEEYLMDNVKDDEYIFYTWRNSKSVLIGRNQNIYSECNLDAIKQDGVNLIRRTSGGGAVYFDEGNVTYSFIAQKKNYDKEFNYRVIIDALAKLGFSTEKSGRNDILFNGKKISGNAFFSKGLRHLHHGTVLYNVNMGDMGKYLRVSKKKLESKGVKSVQSRVTNLIDYTPDLKYEDITTALYNTFCEVGGNKLPVVTPNDILKGNELAKSYYDRHISQEWVFGRNPEFNISFDDRFHWGGVEFNLLVKDNKIVEAKIFTDSLVPDYFDKLNDVLVGKEYHSNTMIDALSETIRVMDFVNKPDEEQLAIINKINEDISNLFKKFV